MAVKTTLYEEDDLTVHVISGPVTEEEMYAALRTSSEEEPTTLVLWDMTLAEVGHITAGVLRRFVKKAAELGGRRQGGRTAVIAPKDSQFGMARMSEAFTELESSPFVLRAFRNRVEAVFWLRNAGPG